jgi:beta-galactosidase
VPGWPFSFFRLHLSLWLTVTDGPRERVSFNAGWRFEKGDPAGMTNSLAYANIKDWVEATGAEFTRNAELAAKTRPAGEPGGGNISYAQSGFNDSQWRLLNLPHDWGIEGPFKQESRRNRQAAVVGRRLVSQTSGGSRIRPGQKNLSGGGRRDGLRDGLGERPVCRRLALWLRLVARGPDSVCQFGADNVIAIRLDNPPDSSRWYPGGGIYRNVWLVKTAPVHVAHWGTYVTTPEVSAKAATVKILVNVDNEMNSDSVVTVKNEIFELAANGDKGKSVGSLTTAGV